MHVKELYRGSCLRLDVFSAVSRIDRKRGAKAWRGVLVLSGWRETTPVETTADNPAYDNNRVKQRYTASPALPLTEHSLQSREKAWHVRSPTRIVISTVLLAPQRGGGSIELSHTYRNAAHARDPHRQPSSSSRILSPTHLLPHQRNPVRVPHIPSHRTSIPHNRPKWKAVAPTRSSPSTMPSVLCGRRSRCQRSTLPFTKWRTAAR